MKKTVWILLITLVLGSVLIALAFDSRSQKDKLFCNSDGDFTILVVSDPQCDTKQQWQEARDELEILIKRSNPDFVMINGDMNSNNIIPRNMWDLFISPVVSRQIYWATTNGNHDTYSDAYYNMYKYYNTCLNDKISAGNPNYEQHRPMNCVIPIYSKDGKKTVFAIYGMDTGSANKYGYEGLTKRQINWYCEQSDALKKGNGGKAVTSLLCMHIPLTQTLDMFYSANGGGAATPKRAGGLYTVYGVTNQGDAAVKNYTCENGTYVAKSFIHTTAPQNDRGMFNKILENGDIKAIVFGHEHKTNIVGSYKGVLLGFAGKLSTGCYSDDVCRGGRVIKFNEECPEKFTVSWLGSMPSSIDQPPVFSDGTAAQKNY